MLDTVDFNHVQHISFTQSRLTDAVSVILSELLSYEHPPKGEGHHVTCLFDQLVMLLPLLCEKSRFVLLLFGLASVPPFLQSFAQTRQGLVGAEGFHGGERLHQTAVQKLAVPF